MYDVNYKNSVEHLKVKLIAHINQVEYVTAQELMDEFDIPRNKTDKYLSWFVSKGYVVRNDKRIRPVNAIRKVYTFSGTGIAYIAKVYGTKDYYEALSPEEQKAYNRAKTAFIVAKDSEVQGESNKQTVVKINETTTMYLNSNKPAGWYNWQRSKRNITTSIASTFSLI